MQAFCQLTGLLPDTENLAGFPAAGGEFLRFSCFEMGFSSFRWPFLERQMESSPSLDAKSNKFKGAG